MGTWNARTWAVVILVGVFVLFVLASQAVEQVTSGQHATPSLIGDLAKLMIVTLLSGEGLVRIAQIWGTNNSKDKTNDTK